MILTSNCGFAEWGEVFGNAVVVQIEGSSYRLRQHAELMPEHVGSKALITPPNAAAVSRSRGRPEEWCQAPRCEI
jgi:hypothetical protein